MKQKANILIELYAWNVTIVFELGHGLDYKFQGLIWNLLYLGQRWFDCRKMKSAYIELTEGLNDYQVWPWPWLWKIRCEDLPDSDRGDFRCRRAVDSSCYHQCNIVCTQSYIRCYFTTNIIIMLGCRICYFIQTMLHWLYVMIIQKFEIEHFYLFRLICVNHGNWYTIQNLAFGNRRYTKTHYLMSARKSGVLKNVFLAILKFLTRTGCHLRLILITWSI